MKKPIYEEYILAHHLQHLSVEARDKLFVADLIQYQEYLQNKNKEIKHVLDFDMLDFDDDNEEVLV